MKHENITTVPQASASVLFTQETAWYEGSKSEGSQAGKSHWHHLRGQGSAQSGLPWRIISAPPFIHEWTEPPRSTPTLASTISWANGFQKCFHFPLLKSYLPFLYSKFTIQTSTSCICVWQTSLCLSSPPHHDLINSDLTHTQPYLSNETPPSSRLHSYRISSPTAFSIC